MHSLVKKSLGISVVTLLIYGLLYAFIDKSIAYAAYAAQGSLAYHYSHYLSQLGNTGLWFSIVVLSLITSLVSRYISRSASWPIPLLCLGLSLVIAMTIAAVCKITLARYRPIMLFEHGSYGLHYFSMQWANNSTPSGHTLRVFAGMTTLSLYFPRYILPAMLIGILVAASRVILYQHYLSDVVFGAYLGSMAAVWSYYLLSHWPKKYSFSPKNLNKNDQGIS